MSNLANRWAGRIYGTNTGNIFLEVTQNGTELTGQLRIMDSIFGVSLYSYVGTFDDALRLECTPKSANEGTEMGNVTVVGKLTSEGQLKGDWSSTIGTAGTFELFPHNTTIEKAASANPEQVYNKTVQLGSIRLFKDDLLQLIEFVKKDFSSGRVVVTYKQHGSELTKYADDFFLQLQGIDKLNYFKIVIQEPEAYGINRVTVIEFNELGTSEIRISGINESWVLGKSESINQLLKKKQNSLVTTYRKYGLNLNGAIFGAMLIAIPEIPDWKNRAAFVLFSFMLLSSLLFLHTRFIPNTAIYLEQAKPSFLKRIWPSFLSWLIAASSGLAAAYAFSLLK